MEMTELLSAHGAQANGWGEDGEKFPAQVAREAGHEEVAEKIARKGRA